MINDLKEFEKFLKICRKQGVSDVSFAGLSVKLGEMPKREVSDELDTIPTDELSPDDLAFYHLPNQGAQ